MKMRIYTHTFHGVKMHSYNDSNVEWRIAVAGTGEFYAYAKNKFTLRNAADLHARLHGNR